MKYKIWSLVALTIVVVSSFYYFLHRESTQKNFFDAVKNGDLKSVHDRLIKEDIDVNVQDEFGYTALHIAALYGHKDLVEMLLNYGADPTIKDRKMFQIPLDIAREKNFDEIVILLQKKIDSAGVVD